MTLLFVSGSCLSWVPEQGTVGASGDLAPLAHLALGLMGEGHMWSPETGWGDAKYVSPRYMRSFHLRLHVYAIKNLPFYVPYPPIHSHPWSFENS